MYLLCGLTADFTFCLFSGFWPVSGSSWRGWRFAMRLKDPCSASPRVPHPPFHSSSPHLLLPAPSQDLPGSSLCCSSRASCDGNWITAMAQLKPTLNPSLFFWCLVSLISPNIMEVGLGHKWVKLGIIGLKCCCCIWKGDKLNGKEGAQLLLSLLRLRADSGTRILGRGVLGLCEGRSGDKQGSTKPQVRWGCAGLPTNCGMKAGVKICVKIHMVLPVGFWWWEQGWVHSARVSRCGKSVTKDNQLCTRKLGWNWQQQFLRVLSDYVSVCCDNKKYIRL